MRIKIFHAPLLAITLLTSLVPNALSADHCGPDVFGNESFNSKSPTYLLRKKSNNDQRAARLFAGATLLSLGFCSVRCTEPNYPDAPVAAWTHDSRGQLLPILPDQTKASEYLLTILRDEMAIHDGKQNYGTVTERFWALTKGFIYRSSSGEVVANARMRIFSLGTAIDVTDATEKPIGTFRERIFYSLLTKSYSVYEILDPVGNVLAESEKFDLFGTTFTLRTPAGKVIAVISRPWVNWLRDDWSIQIVDHKTVDPRILVMIPAYKTSMDKERSESSDSDNKDTPPSNPNK